MYPTFLKLTGVHQGDSNGRQSHEADDFGAFFRVEFVHNQKSTSGNHELESLCCQVKKYGKIGV